MSYTRTYTSNNININSNDNFMPVNNHIIYAIATNKMEDLKKYINKDNVNRVIDNKNNYTALHYAIQMRNEAMIKYILSLDAEPTIKNGNGQDAFDMSLMFQMRTVIDCELAEKNSHIKTQQQTITSITEKLKTSEDHVKYLQSTIDKSSTEVRVLRNESASLRSNVSDLRTQLNNIGHTNTQYKNRCEMLTVENNTMKRKLDTLQIDYNNMETKYNNLKKEFNEQDTIINNLLDANKKKK